MSMMNKFRPLDSGPSLVPWNLEVFMVSLLKASSPLGGGSTSDKFTAAITSKRVTYVLTRRFR